MITGATGLVGRWLATHLVAEGVSHVYGSTHRHHGGGRPSGAGQVNYVSCDLQDAAAVAAALRICRPDLVFHLAARIPHPDPWSSPSATMAVNVLGLINLLEAVLQLKATR